VFGAINNAVAMFTANPIHKPVVAGKGFAFSSKVLTVATREEKSLVMYVHQ
jgi:hypothetical protein